VRVSLPVPRLTVGLWRADQSPRRRSLTRRATQRPRRIQLRDTHFQACV
jgi:hypothetical protein